MLQFSIISRMQSRKTQYNKRDVIAAIERANLTPEYKPGVTMIIYVKVETLEQRKALEANLRAVHRNVAYRVEQLV